jgi:hypothetical protein
MVNDSVASEAFIAPRFRRSSPPLFAGVLPSAVALLLCVFLGVMMLHRLAVSVAAPEFIPLPVAASAPARPAAVAAAVAPKRTAAAVADGALFDAEFAAAPALPAPAPFSAAASRMLVVAFAAPKAGTSAWAQAASALGAAARPAEVVASAAPPAAIGPLALSGKGGLPAAPLPDGRMLQKLFGGANASGGPALAYAPAQGGQPAAAASGPLARYDRWTAVYDLSAHTVYLPNGARLEAHSGLGDRLDNPAHVNERNRGATPPHVYELASLSQPFHGVQALRLNPVGDGGIFGRDGLLAHTYMLGPRGDSNGCVAFRNYNAFLQAYQTGQVKRLAVVARLD